jgi:xanthine dehydrogenase YagS FAD-binding subunit
MPVGGGTDLLDLLARGLANPDALVDLRHLPGATEVRELADGGLRLGAAVTLAQLDAHPAIRRRYPMLAQAAGSVGGEPHARGTLGGNLCARPYCPYFRAAAPCFKNGGEGCPAREGENRYLAILEGGPCYIVHPSDLAVALVALDATVELRGAAGAVRRLPIADFYVTPRERLEHETVLERGEVVAAVELTPDAGEGAQLYLKASAPGVWDFAIVSLAAARRRDGEVRLVLGGVAPRPYRVYGSIEEDVSVGNLDEHDVETLAARALYDAQPLTENGYKVPMAEEMLRAGIRGLWG